jgi:ABC-type uncharacterized transport system auxiliary subunit
MKRLLLLLILPFAVLLGACGHTNQLAKFNINGQKALYRASISSDAASSVAVIESPNDNTALGVAAAIGSVVVSNEGRQKLERAINPDSVAQSVSAGIRQATREYLSIQPVGDISQNPDLIIETEVTDFKIVSSSAGLHVRVRGNSRIIDRKTGEIIWENAESHTVPISETYLAAIAPQAISSGVSIFNSVKLLTLSEDQIRAVVNSAATDAGKEIGETLREDVAEMHKVK